MVPPRIESGTFSLNDAASETAPAYPIYPGAAVGRRLRSFARPYQPSPLRRPGRPAPFPFRGLLGVHSRCSLHTRAVTDSCPALSEGFGHFVTLYGAFFVKVSI